MERFCKDCNAKITGRSDKKFCSDACRNSYNNILWSQRYHAMKDINAILKKNHNILQNFSKSNQHIVAKLTLLAIGFNPCYFTHQQIPKEGTIIKFVYDQGYKESDDEIHLITSNNPQNHT